MSSSDASPEAGKHSPESSPPPYWFSQSVYENHDTDERDEEPPASRKLSENEARSMKTPPSPSSNDSSSLGKPKLKKNAAKRAWNNSSLSYTNTDAVDDEDGAYPSGGSPQPGKHRSPREPKVEGLVVQNKHASPDAQGGDGYHENELFFANQHTA